MDETGGAAEGLVIRARGSGMTDWNPETMAARQRRWRLVWQTGIIIVGVCLGLALLFRIL
jgi:hypothetical protein